MKDNIQALVDLLNGRLERFDRTRNIQWKLNASLWAGMVVAIGFLRSNHIYFSPVVLTMAAVVICIIHGRTINRIQSSLAFDKRLVKKYHQVINRELKDKRLKKIWRKTNDNSDDWNTIQNAVTVLLSLVGVLMLSKWVEFCQMVIGM
ncbi:MAG: hypothetical protein JNJ75_14265 [Cyclobacteriaceae bacterium]|nr:hypothetical protein [Cyclobacteriaceae bacterium]